jgi:CheY-like chemotaxis protein
VLNASEAIEDRPGAIRIRTGTGHVDRPELLQMHLAADLEPGRYVYLEVSDTGRGMSAETLARIFDPFFSTKFTGRGLGLAAVLGIVRSHKGALKVESREGTGSRFRLLLPPSVSQVRPAAPAHKVAPVWRGRGMALVIDDEPSVRHVAQRMLTAMGFEVVTAASGHEGLARFAEHPDGFTIVLLDLTMPGMRGDDTYRKLRSLRTGLPIIVMSGYSHQEASAYFDAHESGVGSRVPCPSTPDPHYNSDFFRRRSLAERCFKSAATDGSFASTLASPRSHASRRSRISACSIS